MTAAEKFLHLSTRANLARRAELARRTAAYWDRQLFEFTLEGA